MSFSSDRYVSMLAPFLCVLLSIPFAAQAANVQSENETPELTLADSNTDSEAAVAFYQDSIRDLEIQGNLFDNQLGQAYLGLARSFEALDQPQQAIESFNQALYLTRINSGLDSELQLPILEQLLIANTELEDWQSVNANYYLFHDISSRNYAWDDPRRIDAVNRLARWNLKAASEKLLDESPAALNYNAAELYRQTIDSFEAQENPNREEIVQLYIGHSLAEYQLARLAINTPLADFRGDGSPSTTVTVCWMEISRTGRPVQVCGLQTRWNPDYYRTQQSEKQRNVARHILAMQSSLQKAKEVLEDWPESAPLTKVDRDELRQLGEDARQLVNEYRNTGYLR